MARPLAVAVLAAVALHGALLVTASAWALRRAPLASLTSTPAAVDAIELSIESIESIEPVEARSEPAPPTTAEPAPDDGSPSRPLVASNARQVRPGATTALPDETTPTPPGGAAGAGPGEAPPGHVVSPFASGEAPDERGRRAIAGLMSGSSWLLNPEAPGAPAVGSSRALPGPRSEDPDRGGKLLRESLDRANQDKGLGFGGPVASAAHQASLSAKAPVQGAVTFEVLTDAAGTVTAVSLRGASGGDWSSVAGVLRSLLSRQKLRVPTGSSGVAVAVRVEAKQQLPSGRAPTERGAKITGVGPLSLSGQFDLADLSSKVTRVVSARVVSERRL